MSTYLRVAAASIGPANGNLSASFEEAGRAIARLAAEGARLVVLPELFALPYTAGEDPSRWPVHAEKLDGPTARWARTEALRHRLDIVFGMALDDGADKPLNAALLASADGTVRCIASKHHLPPPGAGDAFGEADHFSPGDGETACFVLGDVRIAVLICYDRRIAERWNAAAATGADLVLVLVAGPAPQDPDGFYLSELSGHAWARSVHVLAAARAGTETMLGRPVRHDGLTAAIDPSGVVRAQGEGMPGDVAILDLDPVEIAERRSSRERSSPAAQPASLIN